MSLSDPASASNLFSWRLPFSLPSMFAPNPGWSFGNVTINNVNSKDPQAEQTIVSQVSYGRQLGRLVEAVQAMAEMLPKNQKDPRIVDFLALAVKIQEIKAAIKFTRLDALRQELDELKVRDLPAWKQLVRG